MIDIKLSTCAPTWPWARQTPGGTLEWGGFRFHVDVPLKRCDAWVVFESLAQAEETLCPPERIIFIAGEPDSIGSYRKAFLGQFRWVLSGRNDIDHPGLLKIQQGHPWFVEKSFDQLLGMAPFPKTRDVCVISSDKAHTEGHRKRLDFVAALKEALGDRIDVWGRGIRSFDQKWDVLAPYKYAIVLENFAGPDFLTEKLPDALLAYCFPLYFGCTNTGRYLPPNSWLDVDIGDPQGAVALLSRLLADPGDYERRLPTIALARHHYLNNVQFFASLAGLLQPIFGMAESRPMPVLLYPNTEFEENPLELVVTGRRSPSLWQKAVLTLGRGRWWKN